MSKKIVILNGSPRKTGNTSTLVKAFTEGAENAGHTVTEFFLDGMNIHGCKGCFGGHSSQECPCVQKDDMTQIYPAVKESDVVVLATPLYYWNMSGQLRTAICFGATAELRPCLWRRRAMGLKMLSSTMTTLWSICAGTI